MTLRKGSDAVQPVQSNERRVKGVSLRAGPRVRANVARGFDWRETDLVSVS